MKAICIGGEPAALRLAGAACGEYVGLENVQTFSEGEPALAWAEEHEVDIAVVGTNLADVRGLSLAERLRESNPDAEIIILAEDGRYAVDAFQIRACGYLVKPVTRAGLEKELEYALSAQMAHPMHGSSPVVVQTFGTFEIFVNHELVQFERSRAKELLALLVDQRGDRLRRSDVYAEMWDGAEYDRKAQKMLDVIIRSLKKTLTDYHIEHIMEAKDGTMCVFPERLDCDMYRMMAGDRKAISAFHGVYMSNYPWARMTEGYLTTFASHEPEGDNRAGVSR